MAKHQLGKSNQKLYFVSILLETINNSENNDKLLNKKAIVQANLEACLFHLESAYRCFLWEICHTYELEVVAGQSLDDVIAQSQQEGKQIQELNYFHQLEHQDGTWLNSLLKSYQRVSGLDPNANAQVQSAASFNAIEVRKVEEFETPEKIFEWHNVLKTEIENIRPTLSEW
ncbi:MAG: hypothetical protein MI867_13040 [Pseudomonadales bacterium]|nr:hypothetical protein [Pseudomonadales bacterium]